MRNAVRRTLSILAVVGATGCGDPVALTTVELLEGSWTWVESSGGITGETSTPASTGETMTLRFLGADSVELTRNGVLAGATPHCCQQNVPGFSCPANALAAFCGPGDSTADARGFSAIAGACQDA